MDNIRGNPHGGFVYFHKGKTSAWYKWHMTRDMKAPVYEWISPHVGYNKENNTACMAILPDDFDEEEEWGYDEIYVFMNIYIYIKYNMMILKMIQKKNNYAIYVYT
ncbi:MAG: hypothetical protein ACKPKO_47140 [Candidatus Fonsibacter sp.]